MIGGKATRGETAIRAESYTEIQLLRIRKWPAPATVQTLFATRALPQ